MTVALYCAAILALIPALNTIINYFVLRRPPLPSDIPSASILIPARDEEKTIRACVEAALASEGADVEVIVLDDDSRDRTRAIVEEISQRDRRLLVHTAPPLPEGWKGKPHACHVLSGLATRPFLLFVDADVRLAPTAAARLVPPPGVDLVSGVPRQIVSGFVETAVIPMINSLIYGYLPVVMMRRLPTEALTAACGQMMMVRAEAYRRSGGHAAIAGFMHDGMQLAKLFRRKNFRTDLIDGTLLATCRMYDNAKSVIEGFTKNATEGMARPVALPIWTLLLAGGHLLPPLVLAIAYYAGQTSGAAWTVALCATALLFVARVLQAIKCREPWQSIVLHPIGVLITLAIQWSALIGYLRGQKVEWRGRSYAPTV